MSCPYVLLRHQQKISEMTKPLISVRGPPFITELKAHVISVDANDTQGLQEVPSSSRNETMIFQCDYIEALNLTWNDIL